MHDKGTLFKSLTFKSRNDKFDFFFVDGKEESEFTANEKILHHIVRMQIPKSVNVKIEMKD